MSVPADRRAIERAHTVSIDLTRYKTTRPGDQHYGYTITVRHDDPDEALMLLSSINDELRETYIEPYLADDEA